MLPSAHLAEGFFADPVIGSDALLGAAISRLGLSARAYSRVLKLARTCADLAAVAQIESVHVAEAIQLRALDRPIG